VRAKTPNGPFGPLQRGQIFVPAKNEVVSILNGPFGPLQPRVKTVSRLRSSGFNPQRAFRPVATVVFECLLHPASSFNPQRAFRPVATRPSSSGPTESRSFQSSTGLSARCNAHAIASAFGPEGFNPQRAFRPVATPSCRDQGANQNLVSILNGPFGPLQQP